MKKGRYVDIGIQSKVSGRKAVCGFTLLELLVVIAIIGILVTIIVPTVGRVQDRGREVQCIGNLRQLHTAAVLYAENNNRRLPRAFSISVEEADGTAVGARHGWVASVDNNGERDPTGRAWWYERDGALGTASVREGRLFRYVGQEGDEAVYVCPTMARIARSEPGLDAEQRVITRSYGMNSRMSNRRLDRIDGPSRTMLFADQGFANMGGGRRYLTQVDDSSDGEDGEDDFDEEDDTLYWRRYYYGTDGSIDFEDEWIGEYHGRQARETNVGRANVVFVDGHTEQVEYRHTDDIAQGNWERGAPIQ